MVTLFFYALIAIVVAAAIIALLVLVLPDDHLARAPADTVPAGLPIDSEVGADDVARVRLPVAVRGYRMVDTDAVLDRLTEEIERRDREIAALRAARVSVAAGSVPEAEAQAAGSPTVGAAPAVSAARAVADPDLFELDPGVDLEADLDLDPSSRHSEMAAIEDRLPTHE
jgi:hypothetical protein